MLSEAGYFLTSVRIGVGRTKYKSVGNPLVDGRLVTNPRSDDTVKYKKIRGNTSEAYK